MASLRSPLGLTARLKRPSAGLDGTAIATMLISALMLTTLVGSRFVFSPGVTLGLAGDERVALNLPVTAMGKLPGVATEATLVVLALKHDDMAVWNGHIRTLDQLTAELTPKPGTDSPKRGVLLIKADGAVSLNTFMRVVALARRAGFSAVQIAAEEQK